jgi:acetyl esterase
VLSLSYRKALKGVHYPIPSDDVLAGWNWANSNMARFGSSIQRLHLGGASAGGNLTAGVCKRLRDGAGAMPASLVLIYPLVHRVLPDEPPGTLAAVQQRVPGAFFSQPWIDDCLLNYVGDASRLDDPYATPALGFVGNQPPVLIINCELDSLKVSGEDYARRLQAAGVRVLVETLPEALHGCVGDPKAVGGTQCLSIMRSWLLVDAANRAAAPAIELVGQEPTV